MITADRLNKTYDRHRRNANHVLKDVSFQLPETGFVCILGPSGCGKTSLLNAIGGLDRFDNGTITAGDVSVSRYGKRIYEAERNRSFGYIFQNYYLLPEHSVAYNIYLGLHSLKLSHRQKLQRIRQALEAVDMSRYIRRKVGELSGGQQQRIAIARALARKPRVIFADEPTGNLDEANTMNICTLLRQISRNSLVVMVTHEERIANFFADRIIKLDNGRITEDLQSWDRDSMSLGAEKEIYAGDYVQDHFSSEGVSLRILREEGAAPAEVTVIVLKDRILLKLEDNRATTCGSPRQTPVLKEGKRPEMTLEAVDKSQSRHEGLTQTAVEQTRAGRGIRFGMLLREAAQLIRGGGAKRVSMRIFLILLTVLTVWTAADYLTVASVNPEDFVTTHSQLLELKLKGGNVGINAFSMEEYYREFASGLAGSGLAVNFLPAPSTSLKFSMKVFPQTSDIFEILTDFSYIPLEKLSAGELIYGTMPQAPGQIVVDRWVLDALMSKEGIIQNIVPELSFFVGKELYMDRTNAALTIAGISDSAQPAVYLGKTDMLQIAATWAALMPLSDFKAAYPGQYDDLVLSEQDCIININTNTSTELYDDMIGQKASFKSGIFTWTIAGVVQTNAKCQFIVHDSQMERYMQYLCTSRYYVYCEDKAAVKTFLEQQAKDAQGTLVVDVIDRYSDAWALYTQASEIKVSTRMVVTLTVMLLSMVMLYLLCRSQAQERIGMMAVYRLLGIPKRKLAVIFTLEAVLASLSTALPAAVVTWLVIALLGQIESLQLSLILPWQAALGVYGGTLLYHILAALLPLRRLLRMPPAQLAAKYDY